jgi:thiol-disulfide isomerase/thioredoxin
MRSKLFITLILCAVAAGLCACGGRQGYTIQGPAEGADYAVLRIFDFDGKTLVDTAAIQNGRYVFSGSVDDVYMGEVLVFEAGQEPVRHFLYVENAPLAWEDGYFRGGPNNDFNVEMEAVGASLDSQAPDYREQLVEKMNACFLSHPDVEAAAFFYYNFNREAPLDKFEADYNTFTERVQNSLLGKNGRDDIIARRATGEGTPAPAFTLSDREGNPVSLESLRGQYVLLDFWASWCHPCRESMPHLKELYAQYHEKGLEILGISTDSKSEDWLQAVREDATPWIHVLDRGVAETYGVHAVPTFFLVDPEGIMVGKIDHDALDAVLQRLLD